jgi:hypothetical protein
MHLDNRHHTMRSCATQANSETNPAECSCFRATAVQFRVEGLHLRPTCISVRLRIQGLARNSRTGLGGDPAGAPANERTTPTTNNTPRSTGDFTVKSQLKYTNGTVTMQLAVVAVAVQAVQSQKQVRHDCVEPPTRCLRLAG